jgi:ribosomal-protein-alanine N-acetyltransferase
LLALARSGIIGRTGRPCPALLPRPGPLERPSTPMTPAVAVHLAASSDATDIAVMSRDLIEHGLPWTWRPDRVARAIASADTNVVVVREDGALTAFGIMEYLDDDAYLVLFAVRGTRQRQGVGSAVLRWLEAAAVAAGACRIRVDARRDNRAARSFYNEHGYHEVRIAPRRYDGQIDQIRLEKWLRARDGGPQAPSR